MFPTGERFRRPLSHRDEAACPHRNHTTSNRAGAKEPAPLNGNLKAVVQLPRDSLSQERDYTGNIIKLSETFSVAHQDTDTRCVRLYLEYWRGEGSDEVLERSISITGFNKRQNASSIKRHFTCLKLLTIAYIYYRLFISLDWNYIGWCKEHGSVLISERLHSS